MVYIWGKKEHSYFLVLYIYYFTCKISNFGETFQIQSQVLLSVAQLREYLLPGNWVYLLVGAKPIDATKLKIRRRKDLLLVLLLVGASK